MQGSREQTSLLRWAATGAGVIDIDARDHGAETMVRRGRRIEQTKTTTAAATTTTTATDTTTTTTITTTTTTTLSLFGSV